MKLADEIFEGLEEYTGEEIVSAINKRIVEVGFEGVKAESAIASTNGDTLVTFVDDTEEEAEMLTLFSYDPDEGAEAILIDKVEKDDDDEAEVDMVDLDALEPKLIDLGGENKAINLVDNDWMNETFFETLFSIGQFMDGGKTKIEELSAFVIRGGKKVKVALVRRKRKKRLTPVQKAGIKKGALKRKQKSGAISRKRKKSLKLRKRTGLKKNTNTKLKVQGT